MNEQDTRELLCEMLRLFYDKGWVTGTGGGISGSAGPDRLLLAPTGVHKERVQPDDLFVVSTADGSVVADARTPGLRPSECNGIFCAVVRARAAGSVMHSHGLATVLAGDLASDADHLRIEHLEMLKGIRGVANTDVHLVPVLRNTPREHELLDQVEQVLADPRFSASYAILVADHGAYIWGRDVWEAKRHAEVYHFLFEALVARARR